jgi:dynein intermediate chain 1, axonemal
LAVYAVKWNTFHPRVFLSCSADWTIKMWDKDLTRPIMTFDLGCAVGDVEWAPYSSTGNIHLLLNIYSICCCNISWKLICI